MRNTDVLPDPPVRADGKCAVCEGKRREYVKSKYGKYASPADFEDDPFCSTVCARAWHGLTESRTS